MVIETLETSRVQATEQGTLSDPEVQARSYLWCGQGWMKDCLVSQKCFSTSTSLVGVAKQTVDRWAWSTELHVGQQMIAQNLRQSVP